MLGSIGNMAELGADDGGGRGKRGGAASKKKVLSAFSSVLDKESHQRQVASRPPRILRGVLY